MNNPIRLPPPLSPPLSPPPPASSSLSSSSSSTLHPDQYIHQLSNQIKAHESQLAPLISHSNQNHHPPQPASDQSQWISFPTLTSGLGFLNPIPNSLPSSSSRRTTLKLDPHHLYYLLLKFDQLGLQSVPLDINLTDRKNSPSISKTQIKSYDPTDWMIGFDPSHPLINKPASCSSNDRSDTISLFSNLSLRSNPWWSNRSSSSSYSLPNPSSLISNLLLLPGRSSRSSNQPSIEDHVKYLYSTFTKLPTLCLTPSSNPSNTLINHHRSTNPILSSSSTIEPMQLLEGFTDLPNQNAVSLSCFKSIWSLYLQNLDPRLFTGWDQISQNLRSLDIRRSGLEDFEAFLVDAIMDDVERERRRKKIEIDLVNEQTDQTTHDHCQPSKRPATPESSHPPPSIGSSPTSASLPIGFPTLTWGFLQHLCLADNSLTFLSTTPLKALKSLSSLDLSSNLLIAVPTGLKDLPRLKLLNLSDNMIDSVLGIYHSLNSVTSVNLSRNRLSSLCGLERLTTLERLDIRSNQIHDISELSRLAVLPKLTSLWTSENPFCSTTAHHQADWRIEIFNYFSSENREIDYRSDLLIHLTLDNQTPTYSERKLIKKPLGRPSTPELSIISEQSRRTLVRSPDKKNHYHPPRLKKLEDHHDPRTTHPQGESTSPLPIDSSGPSPSVLTDRSLPSSSITTMTSATKRVGSIKKKDKPSRKKMTRIVELQNNRSSNTTESSSSTITHPKRGNEAGKPGYSIGRDLEDRHCHHPALHSAAVSSFVGSSASVSWSARLSPDGISAPHHPPAKLLLRSTSSGHQPQQRTSEEANRSVSSPSTASSPTPTERQAYLPNGHRPTSSHTTRPTPTSEGQLPSSSSSFPPPHSHPNHLPLHLPIRSDSDYDGLKLRQKIEALKVELGEDAWLKVLGESEFGCS